MIDMHIAVVMIQLSQLKRDKCGHWPEATGWNGWRDGAVAVLLIGLLALGVL